MPTTTAPPIDAIRWARLKDHVADLGELDASERAAALAALDLDGDDRAWLERIAAPMLAQDARMDAPHPSARAVADNTALRCKPGDRVGQYRIDGLLGRGGMGEVYEATDGDGERVALKVLRSGLAHSDYERFSGNEQRALRRLDDPRIAKFIEAFVAPDLGACLVLECVDGEPLQTYCRSRRFSVDARLKLFIEVCNAVAGAHAQLVVHRDLKPGNVLVTPDGHVKLLDFGVSKLLDDTTAQTSTYGNLFTLDYAAPEQVLHEPVSTATDVYALGVLLFRLLTEDSPYERNSDGLVKAVLNDPPQRIAAGIERARLSGLAPPAASVDRDLDRIVAHAMEKEPRQRYRSALELAADVLAVIEGRPILGGGGAWYRVRKFTRRHRTAMLAASVATLALLAATVFSLQSAATAEREAHNARVANDFLLTALDITDRFSGKNQGDVSLVDVLERAVASARVELRDEPDVRAGVLVRLSMALQHQGKSATALIAAREAHALRAEAVPADPAGLAAASQQLASLEIESGLLDPAGKHLEETLAQLALLDNVDNDRIGAYTSLGKLASMRGDPAASLRWYERIVPLRAALPGDHRTDLAMDYNNLGTGLYNMARYQDADAAYVRAVALLRDALGPTHPRVGFVLFGRASALAMLGRFDDARAALDQADVALGSGGGAPGSVNTERTRALLDLFAGAYPSALHRLDGVLPQTRIASPVSVPSTMVLLGRVQLASGDHAAAQATLAAAEKLYVDSGRTDHPQRWFARGLAGVARAATGDLTGGDAQLDDALRQLTGDGRRGSAEQIELLLRAGAAARRSGDAARATALHAKADAMQRTLGWLGELGRAYVQAEQVLDAGVQGTDDASVLDAALATLQRVAPNDPRVAPLLALQTRRAAVSLRP